MCANFQQMWPDNAPNDYLIALFLKGINFCMEKDFPSVSYIKEHFSRQELAARNIFVEGDVSLSNVSSPVVILGKGTSAKLSFDELHVYQVFVSQGAKVVVSANGLAKVKVYAYSSASVFFCNNSASRQYAYQYGSAAVAVKGDIAVRKY